MNNIKVKKMFIALVSLAFIIGTFVQWNNVKKHQDNDLRVYYKIAVRMQTADSSAIYALSDGAFPYRYVPFTLPFISWMSHFSEHTVRYVWFFIQLITFLLSLWIMSKVLNLLGDKETSFTLAVSLFLMFRYYLDSYSSGQLFGILLVFYASGLYLLLKQKTKSSVTFFLGASAIKLVPGVSLIFAFLNEKKFKDKCLIVFTFLALFLLMNLLFMFWYRLNYIDNFGIDHLKQIWRMWWTIVTHDAEYFDGTTTKNQALRGFLLRFFGKDEGSEFIWKISFLVSLIALGVFWILKKSQNVIYIFSSYSLSILFFILLMPQSLPYQVMNAFIPVVLFVFIIQKNFKRIERILLALVMLTLTFPSSGLLGRSLANQLQYFSLPMFTLTLLTLYFIRLSSQFSNK
jgi:hypothetical protein